MLGGLLGALVGDFVGAPYEFMSSARVPALIGPEHLDGFIRAHASAPAGAYTDDGAQMIALCDSLVTMDRFDPFDFGARLLAWERGRYWVDGKVFDEGTNTFAALAALRDPKAYDSRNLHASNGSLMRTLPVALWTWDDTDAETVRMAEAASAVTHAHVGALAACGMYCLWAKRTLRFGDDSFVHAAKAYRDVAPGDRWNVLRERMRIVDGEDVTTRSFGTDALDTLQCARRAVIVTSAYDSAIRQAIWAGGDTDTQGIVTGGVAGIQHGVGGSRRPYTSRAIPYAWLARLAGREIWMPIFGKFIARASRGAVNGTS
jgi:ADP-ribosylglycohydrolase